MTAVPSLGDPVSEKEYQVKAAFTFNFIKFVNWPKDKTADSNEPIIMGVIGNSPSAKAFEPIKGKKVGGKSVVLKMFRPFEQIKKSIENDEDKATKEIEDMKRCHVLFVCISEKEYFKDIMKIVGNNPVLTVADADGFLESGGIINLIAEEGKIRFEISAAAAKKAKLKIRSQLLRLAKRVIE